ncbi:MAG: ferrous iron transport protein B [Bacteroidota bacterium]|nr:ferrous iron transport protein B [Bacteroidota bacterium]
MNTSKIKVVLAGNPNSGKSTLFNALTGLRQKVGNYPGITVEKRTGNCNLNKNSKAEIIDVPGAYSLYPKSIDEWVAQQVICNKKDEGAPEVTVVVADATNLRRSIFLITQIIDLKMKVVLALNMVDLSLQQGLIIDVSRLSEELKIPVVAINARKQEGIGRLKQAIIQADSREVLPSFFDVRSLFNNIIEDANELRKTKNDYDSFLALCLLDTNEDIKLNSLCKKHQFIPSRAQAQETIRRYKKIDEVVDICCATVKIEGNRSVTKWLDDVLIHPVCGYFIFLGVLFLIFQAIFSWSVYPMDLIDSLFTDLSVWVAATLPAGVFNDLLVKGVLAGLGGIIIFVPQIAFLFAFIAFLEDTGYMARVGFITDKILRGFGLNGRSIIPLLSGAACAIPAIMSARTISSWKERMITIMVTPLMSCSARLPVYTLIIAVMIPSEQNWGPFNLQGLVMMAFYLLGFLAALGTAFVLKFILKAKERSYYIMEMPSYKIPDWKTVIYTIVEKVKVFLFDAGKVIIAISIVLWFLSSYAPGNRFEKIDAKWAGKENAEIHIAAEKLEVSYAGIIGKSIEPAIKPLGFDWKIGIALITSFAAREVFVGTMSTIYSVGDESTQSIKERLESVKNPETSKPFFTGAVGISLMLFYAFAMQCMSTLAIVRRETNSWKWPIVQFLYMGILAYLSSLIAYQILS